MNYDVWGSFSPTAGPNAPLADACAPADDQVGSATRAVQVWTGAGVPANKLVLGVPSYGHSFSVSAANASSDNFATLATHPGFDASQHPLGSEDDGNAQPFTDVCGVTNFASGDWDFKGLVQAGYVGSDGSFANKTGTHRMFDNCSQTPMIYDETSQVWISYDDPQSFAAKGSFVMSSGLRGFAMYEAGGDLNDALLDSILGAAGVNTTTAANTTVTASPTGGMSSCTAMTTAPPHAQAV